MIGFEYGIFVLYMSARSAFFLQLCLPVISMNTCVTWYPGETDAIIFGKSVSFVEKFCDKKSWCIFVL